MRISYPNICQAKWHFDAYLSDHFHMISLFLPRKIANDLNGLPLSPEVPGVLKNPEVVCWMKDQIQPT